MNLELIDDLTAQLWSFRLNLGARLINASETELECALEISARDLREGRIQ